MRIGFRFEIDKVVIYDEKKTFEIEWKNDNMDTKFFRNNERKEIYVIMDRRNLINENFQLFKKYWRYFKKLVNMNVNVNTFSIVSYDSIQTYTDEKKEKKYNLFDLDFNFSNLRWLRVEDMTKITMKALLKFMEKHKKLIGVSVVYHDYECGQSSYDELKMFCKYVISERLIVTINWDMFCPRDSVNFKKNLLLLLLVLESITQIGDIDDIYICGRCCDDKIYEIINDYYYGEIKYFYLPYDDCDVLKDPNSVIDNIIDFFATLHNNNVIYCFLLIIKEFI
jgi:hypothetical protein